MGCIHLGLYVGKDFGKRKRLRERNSRTLVELDRQPQPKVSNSIEIKYGASSTYMAELCWTVISL